jgi:hypothetical protein
VGSKLIGNKHRNVYSGKFEPLIEWTVPRRQMPGPVRKFFFYNNGRRKVFVPPKSCCEDAVTVGVPSRERP